MVKKRSRLIVILALAVALAFSSTVSSFAAEGISTRQVGTFSIWFERPANTSGEGTLTANTFSTATYIKATVTLQKRVSSGVFQDVSGQVKTKTVYNSSDLNFYQSWSLQNSESYRLKVILEDVTNGIYFKTSGYSNIE